MSATVLPRLRPHPVQRVMRASGVRNRLFPRAKFDQWQAQPRLPYAGMPSVRVARRIDAERGEVAGRPVYRVRPKLAPPAHARLLYLHGGAYVLDLIPSFHWPAIAKLVNATGRGAVVPIYPLAPEHTYRATIPFLLGVYREMLAEYPAERIAFVGDSAGGGLAFALCHAARDAGLPPPSDAVLISPWLHLGLPAPDVAEVARRDPVLNVDDLRAAAIRYAGGDPLDTPLLSPAVGPLDGLPRLTVFTGTNDVLNPDARVFHRRAIAEGLDVGWHELEGGMHCWPLLPAQRQARDAFAGIRRLLGATGN
ncbi:alpha/beta hydrolase [Mycobacterium sp. MYCO198283]|uniref:alpha/beta hydrolase fold domain-containing protein n=1 Tax=Mycobacterium sp. MYCO198283 TaxID=2883505 RepID=UPI001E32D0F0|nr:alpha/beta hydrolase [Mycobacterium sp. MYCO198283]MCG5433173.1 alpha/beta hydrolase [Mycobacterium sp. MYCO198283]